MPSLPDLSFSRTLPLSIFNRLGELLHQMAQAIGDSALILTEAVLERVLIPIEWQPVLSFSAGTQQQIRQIRFTLVVSQQFSALLVGNIELGEERDGIIIKESTPLDSLYASLTFNSNSISAFVCKLRNLFASNSHTYQNIAQYEQIIVTNDAILQSKFTVLLLECLIPLMNQEVQTSTYLSAEKAISKPLEALSCKPVEDALLKQVAQERLLHQVTTQIRKSLDLEVIMSTAITQVREFLGLDRLVIYKFPSTPIHHQSRESEITNYELPKYGGRVVYESLATDSISSVLNFQEEDCLNQYSLCWEKYKQGFILAVDDVEKTYSLEDCLLNFLRKNHIRSKLVAPIVFEDKLWGLLIAHQCYCPRIWNDSEKSLLSSIAEQLAIAIHQSELMSSLREATRILTQEKQSLEQRVIERTMALREALLAAEAASRLRSEFLATISHELLSPLTCVIGMSSTLLRWPLGELSQRQRYYLQTIHDSGEHLLEMINDILDLSQIEAGKTVLNISEFSLVNTAQNILDSLLEKATSKNVTLQIDLQINPTSDIFIADSGRVEQIIWNLLTNAIKFTPEGGSVTLRLWVEENTAVFQVEDTGIGIPEEKLPLLFEKFQQLDTPYRRRYEGTGVGLALTKQLVELHRGRIEVESTVGMGSIFTVWIPKHNS
jgi:two-component system, sensor histidine kinase and response regulator